MKLIIDIPNYNLKEVQNGSIASKVLLEAIKNGTPYEERPIGHWVKRGFNEYCQFCHCMKWNFGMDFCGRCGADMKGGTE